MDRKTAEDLFPGKTYEFEGRQWRESGEVRTPKDGEIFLSYPSGEVSIRRGTGWTFREGVDKRTILTPVETSPRILTGYVSNAKAGDVYQYGGDEWWLIEYRLPLEGEHFIADSNSCVWSEVYIASFDYTGESKRWIVVAHEPGEESKADAMTDALTRISHRADGLKAILLSKHEDYGGSVYKTPRFVPQATPRDAMLIRLGDKVERLERLLGGNKANVNESVDDTLLDLAGYALLILAEKEIP